MKAPRWSGSNVQATVTAAGGAVGRVRAASPAKPAASAAGRARTATRSGTNQRRRRRGVIPGSVVGGAAGVKGGTTPPLTGPGHCGQIIGMEIDLNCDLGEGCPHDVELMALITSANIACGFHAGDPATARAALEAAARHGVQAGAHPGFPDREHFGRRELDLPPRQVLDNCVY